MKVSVKELEDQRVELTVELPAEELEKGKDRSIKRLAGRINIPGFRKGKAPRKVIETQVGKEYILDDAFDIIYPDALEEALKQEDITPAGKVDLDVKNLKDNEDVVFTAEFTKRPEVTLGEYKGLSIPKKEAAVTDEDVDKEIKRVMTGYGKLLDAEEGHAAQNGDLMTLDFEGFRDGEPFGDGSAKDYILELGSGEFIPGFEDQHLGLKVGDEKEVNVTFPEDYHEETLKGKPALFKCKVNALRIRELPELNDEFAKKAAKVDTVEEWKKTVKDRLTRMEETKALNEQAQAGVEKAAENITVNIPGGMIEDEIDRIMNELALNLEQQGINFDEYLESINSDAGQLREGQRTQAEKNVRTNLMLEEVAKAEDITVTPQDRAMEILMMAMTYNAKPQEINKIIRKQGIEAERNLQQTILRKKTARFIIDNIEGRKKADEDKPTENSEQAKENS